MENCIIVGIAGGTGSGKSSVAQQLLYVSDNIVLLEQDAYYKDLNHLPLTERKQTNFDHPNAIEFGLMIEHLKKLKEGVSVQRPIYDFSQHTRIDESITLSSAKVILVEGILIFAVPELREMLDVKIFMDTDDDERLLRRIDRDIKMRGRDFESVKKQYLETVKPMHLEFVEPSKRYADVIIPRGGENKVAMRMVKAKIKHILEQEHII